MGAGASSASAEQTPAKALSGTWKAVDIHSWPLDSIANRLGKTEVDFEQQFTAFERVGTEDGKHRWQYGTLHHGYTHFHKAGQNNRFRGSEQWCGEETLVNANLVGDDLFLMRVVRPRPGNEEPGARITIHEKWTRAGVVQKDRM